jgi:hypothetical protein
MNFVTQICNFWQQKKPSTKQQESFLIDKKRYSTGGFVMSDIETEDMWLTQERKSSETMHFQYIVSSMGTILRVRAEDTVLWKKLGVEIFDTYLAAVKRFTDGDDDRIGLLYFEEI